MIHSVEVVIEFKDEFCSNPGSNICDIRYPKTNEMPNGEIIVNKQGFFYLNILDSSFYKNLKNQKYISLNKPIVLSKNILQNLGLNNDNIIIENGFYHIYQSENGVLFIILNIKEKNNEKKLKLKYL
ncbi:hypothetical protein [Caminibacter sp.]